MIRLVLNLEDIVTDVVDLYDWWVALAEFRVEHAFKTCWSRDEDEFVGIEDTAFHTELDITQFRIIDKLGVDPRASAQWRVSNVFDRLAAVASSEDVG